MPFNKPTKPTSYNRAKPKARAKSGLRAGKKYLTSNVCGTRTSRTLFANTRVRSRFYYLSEEETKAKIREERKAVAAEKKRKKQLKKALAKLGIEYAE